MFFNEELRETFRAYGMTVEEALTSGTPMPSGTEVCSTTECRIRTSSYSRDTAFTPVAEAVDKLRNAKPAERES